MYAHNAAGYRISCGVYSSPDIGADFALLSKAHTFKYAARAPRYGKRNFICTIVPRWKALIIRHLLRVEIYE